MEEFHTPCTSVLKYNEKCLVFFRLSASLDVTHWGHMTISLQFNILRYIWTEENVTANANERKQPIGNIILKNHAGRDFGRIAVVALYIIKWKHLQIIS